MAFNPADAHGCPVCPHPVTGPARKGSPDVKTNMLDQMRVGDPGIHMLCCGPNKWNVAAGSSTVFVNNIKAARMGDKTSHCGGSGNAVTASPNVFIGG
jgi:uncharacterized Zn-binding protein involved in type VI secretion